MTTVYEYLIVAVDENDIEGYYLLTDSQMAKADNALENGGDYWSYLSKRKNCRHLGSATDLFGFMTKHKVKLKGEFGCTTY